MKLQSLLLGSLLIVAGGLAACSPGNSVSVPTCLTPGCVPTPGPSVATPTPTPTTIAPGTVTQTFTGTQLPSTFTAASITVTSNGGNLAIGTASTTAPSGFAVPAGGTFLGTQTISNIGSTAFTTTGTTTFTSTLTAAATPPAGSSCFIGVSVNGAPFAYFPATLSGSTLSASTTNSFTLPAGQSATFGAYCVPPAGATPTPLPGSTSVPITSGSNITVPPGSAGFGTTTVNVTGLTGGGTINVTPISTNPPAGFTVFAPPSGTVYGYVGLQNPGTTALTGSSATINITAPAGVPAGSSCFLAYAPTPTSSYITVGPTAVNGNVYTFSNSSSFSLPAGQSADFAFFCNNAPPGSVTVTPVSNATTPLPTPAGALPGTIAVGTVSGTAPIALGPITTSAPSTALALPSTFGPAVAYQQTANTGNTTDTFSGTNSISVTLPSVSSSNLYYLGVSGIPGTTGYVGNFGPATVNGNTLTFTTTGSFTIPGGTTLTQAVYTVPNLQTAPSPVPSPVISNGQAVYPVPGPTTASANGSTSGGNFYLASPPPGTSIAQGAAGGSVSATSIATPSPATVAGIGLPTYNGGNGNFTAQPIYYGSFVFSGTTQGVTANGSTTQQNNIAVTVPGLATYAATNPTKCYFLAPIDTTTTAGYITTGTVGGQSFPIAASVPSSSSPCSAAVGTGAGGTTANQVNFVTTNSQVFTPGRTYGYAVVVR